MSVIQISSPFIRGLSHQYIEVTGTKSLILDYPSNINEKRISVIIQNTSATDMLEVFGNPDSTSGGILVIPLSTLSLDNYNGQLYAISRGSDITINLTIGAV